MDTANMKWVKMESQRPKGYELFASTAQWGERVSSASEHECTFYLNNKNQHLLEEKLNQVSDPSNPMYGKHMTRDEIDALIKDDETENAVAHFIESIGARITKRSSLSISATAPISVWENALHTEFFSVKMPHSEHSFTRAKEYSLPENISNYVASVMNTVQLPAEISRGPIIHGPVVHGGPLLRGGPVHKINMKAD